MYRDRELVLLALLSGLILTSIVSSNGTAQEERELATIAIKPPKISKNIEQEVRSQVDLVKLLAQLEESLQKIRKFNVLTRDKDKMKAIMKEQKFAESEKSAGNAAEEGELKAANFIVYPEVQDFKFGREHQSVPNITGKFSRVDSGSMLVHMEVLDTEEGEIKSTFNITSSFKTDEKIVNAGPDRNPPGDPYPDSSHVTDLTNDIASQFADKLLATVFPMTVINVAGGNIYINRGQDGGLSEGDMLLVFQTGKKLRDPDTGKVLGTTEVKIGKAKVTRVNPKFTIAEMVETESGESVEKGYILRKPKSDKTKE